MYTQNAEALLRSVTENVHNPKFDIELTTHCVKKFNTDFKLGKHKNEVQKCSILFNAYL